MQHKNEWKYKAKQFNKRMQEYVYTQYSNNLR